MTEAEPRGEKRASPSDGTGSHDGRPQKRSRTSIWASESTLDEQKEKAPGAADKKKAVVRPSSDSVARDGLRRSIAVALQHVGFESASEEALESVTAATETCEIIRKKLIMRCGG
jgi:transcription initiation factor TFIID subunit 8